MTKAMPRLQIRLTVRCAGYLFLAMAWPCWHTAAQCDEIAAFVERVTSMSGIEFVHIPPGELRAVPHPDPSDFEAFDKRLQKRSGTYSIHIKDSYYVAKTELTCEQWVRLMGSTPWEDAEISPDGGDLPAVVSWFEAMEYCRSLTKKATGEGAHVRLPLEIEWEYACRAGSRSHYCFGDDPVMLDGFAWHQGNNEGRWYHPVGTKKPNAWGIHDMHGSVWEWCADFESDEYPPAGASREQLERDHRNLGLQDCGRVVRGGGPSGLPFTCRSDFRRPWPARSRTAMVGLRVVISAHNQGYAQGFFVPP